MLLVLISWCWIGLCAFLWGFAGLHILSRINGYQKKEAGMVFVFGLCLLGVYAQFFSLFYKVGLCANIVLFIADAGIIWLLRIRIIEWIKAGLQLAGVRLMCIACLMLIIGLAVAVISSGPAGQYDTGLYHAQSIRWIEEYGTVPGLGCLHNRLAYNSAIFSLQALFSLKFLTGQPLHSVNGFFACIFLVYAVCSIKAFRQGKFFASDFLRLSLIIYLNENFDVISSAGSDLAAVGLVLYIFAQWVSYIEDAEEEMAPYAYLCIIGVFAISVKLSAAAAVLFAVMPALRLAKGRRWKEIYAYLAAGGLAILPFLVRNVLISGYLIYPYPELDLFHVDWKMPAYTLLYDRNEIKAWGWGLKDVNRFSAPFSEWFPVWFGQLNKVKQALFCCNAVCMAVVFVSGIKRGVEAKNWDRMLIAAVGIAGFFLWFLGAPLPRYGSAYLMVLPFYFVGSLLHGIKISKQAGVAVIAVMAALGGYYMQPVIHEAANSDFGYFKRCAGYSQVASSTRYSVGDWDVYVPDADDRAWYDLFPSTPYAERIPLIMPRGDSLGDGFCMREEYRKAFVSTYGVVYEENMFDAK